MEETGRIRGKSLMFTYNFDFYGRPLPGREEPMASEDDLWERWRVWSIAKGEEIGIVRETSTLELSLDSDLSGRVHIHWKVDLKKAVDWARKKEAKASGSRGAK